LPIYSLDDRNLIYEFNEYQNEAIG
jgi:hypothetical protein